MRFTYADPCEGFDRSRVKGVVCELIEVRDARYTTAVEVCAGGKLFQVVVDNEKTGELLLKKGNLQRRVTIIPLNKIRYHTVPPQKVLSAQKLCPSGDACLALTLVGYDKSVQEAIEYVFGSTIVCDTLEAARKVAFDPSVRTRSVTVDGDVCDPSGVLEGGSRSRGKSVLSLLSSVNSVRGEVKSLEKEASGLHEELKVRSLACVSGVRAPSGAGAAQPGGAGWVGGVAVVRTREGGVGRVRGEREPAGARGEGGGGGGTCRSEPPE